MAGTVPPTPQDHRQPLARSGPSQQRLGAPLSCDIQPRRQRTEQPPPHGPPLMPPPPPPNAIHGPRILQAVLLAAAATARPMHWHTGSLRQVHRTQCRHTDEEEASERPPPTRRAGPSLRARPRRNRSRFCKDRVLEERSPCQSVPECPQITHEFGNSVLAANTQRLHALMTAGSGVGCAIRNPK